MNEAFVRRDEPAYVPRSRAAGLGVVALNSLLGPRLLAETQATALPLRGVVNPLHFRRSRSASFFLYQQAGRRISRRSTTSRSSRDVGDADAGVAHQGTADRQLQDRSACFGSDHGFKRFGESDKWSASCFRTSAASSTRPASFGRCGPSRSTTTRPYVLNSGSIITGRPSIGS